MNNKSGTAISSKKAMGGWAFLPFLILIGIVIAKILVNAATGTPQTGNSFPITAVVLIATVASFFIGSRGDKVSNRVDAFSKGAANPTTLMMVVIFLLAGVFTSVSQSMGGIESLSNFLLQFIPKNMIYAGLLFVTSIVSFSIGTSVGTVTAMVPIAVGLANQAGLDVVIAVSAVVGGASLGDNLSFVSDTTIAATRGLGCEMKDKFKFNIMLVIPALIIALIIYGVLGTSAAGGAAPEIGSYNIIKMLPYFYIIVVAIAGMNIMTVLTTGIIFSTLIGFCFGDFTVMSFMSAVGAGMTKMSNTIFISLLFQGMMGVVAYNGGIDWLINKLTSNIKTAKGAQYSVAALAFLLGALIRSTSAIIVAAPLAKTITEPYKVDARRTASLLDIFATMQNGVVFWAGLTVDASSLADGVDPVSLVRFAIYPICIAVITLLSIQFNLFQRKGKTVS